MLKRKFYYDLQVHTSRYSPCSELPPERLIAHARACRLDGIAITEHDRCWSADEIHELQVAAGAPSFTVLAGTELRTMEEDRFTGDLIVFGAAELPPDPCSIDTVCRLVHRQGGIVLAPHPYAERQGIGEETVTSAIDALEVYNFRYRTAQSEKMVERNWRHGGLAGTASSDAHQLNEVGRYCTEFEQPIHNVADLIEAILDRRCRPRHGYPPRRFLRFR